MPAAAVEQQYAAVAVRPTAAQRSPMLEQRGPVHLAQQPPMLAAAVVMDMPVLVAAVDMPVLVADRPAAAVVVDMPVVAAADASNL